MVDDVIITGCTYIFLTGGSDFHLDRVYYSKDTLFKQIEKDIAEMERQGVSMIHDVDSGHIYDIAAFKVYHINVDDMKYRDEYDKPVMFEWQNMVDWIQNVNPTLYEKIQKEFARRKAIEDEYRRQRDEADLEMKLKTMLLDKEMKDKMMEFLDEYK